MSKTDDGQRALWNGAAGCAWVDAQDLTDRLFTPFEELLVHAARATSPRRVLDVGCGTGAVTVAIAGALDPGARCVGIDISEPMLAAARARAARAGAPADFVHADAQRHPFDPAGFDLLVSRFGVMFFDDPAAAFANLHHAAGDGADLRFIAWRGPEENPFMTTAERAVAHLLPNLPAREPNAPGQFAFADADRVRRLLEEGGWSGVDIRPVDVACGMSEPDLMPYLTRFGPVGRVLPEADEATRARVVDTARAAFAPFVHGEEVRFTAACWMIAARA